ncbi:glycosyltransferase family 9 protein [Gryllotalpicola ginsengisoli]|uniref:glycosyltransferase family 9 protein n=1 Tax=Gryllotalpicola ginsengisoli TaxID=444608 RepID=UPI0003B6FF12|nr:glycosyltransferase family 9 protein [Gryllotalpicola ginsengisoli]
MSDDRPTLLALRALKLGDLLVAVPALKALRRRFPGHRLVYAAPGWLEPIVRLVGDDSPAIDELLPTPGLDEPLPWAGGPVDVAVNLHGRGPESTGVLERLSPRLRLGHAAPGWLGPEWRDGGLERERWARVATFPDAPADADDVGIMRPEHPSPMPGAAVVHVGAFYAARHWPEERFAAVLRELARRGLPVVVTGGPADGDRAREVARQAGVRARVFAGEASLPLDHVAALIAGARLLVSVDTGVAHLASAFGTPSVVIFGPAPPEEWGPPPGPHVVLTDASLRRGDIFAADADPALLAVTAADVIGAADRLLAQDRTAAPPV